MKLRRKHAQLSDEPDSRIRDNIRNHPHYQPTADDDDPVTCSFVVEGIVPWSGKTVMKCLTRSASFVPVENMFSTMGLIVKGE